jgi:hypothetical protein
VPSRSAEAIHHLEYALAKRPELPVARLLAELKSTNEDRRTKKE